MPDTSLLVTKMRIPPRLQSVIARTHLQDRLEQEVPHHKLTIVTAPAGYGKTTLLAEWARSSRRSVAWLALDAEDNDFERFFRYLLAAWEEAQPGVQNSPLGLWLGAMAPDREAVLSAFINVGATALHAETNIKNEMSGHTVFVLDDYHLIEEPAIHQALIFLLDHLPPKLHFVLAARVELPLPLARYRARNELLTLDTEDMQFSVDETEDFLNHRMGFDLTQSEIISLQAELEGWIAGLQLAALSRRRRLNASRHPSRDHPPRDIEAEANEVVVTGRHRFIADYLREDVIAHLPADVLHFLFQTSILDHLCHSLCEAVTARVDCQEMLELLERENLFLMPLDDRREWFRYHGLFADFLYEELKRRDPDAVVDLHRRAARWYLAQDFPEQAFRHALDGNDVELVVELFDCYVHAKLNSGEIRVIERWVEALPAEWYAAYPVLGLARVGFLAFTGALEACMRGLDEVEQRLTPVESDEGHWQLARVIAVRCMVACMQNDLMQAKAYADQALRNLPEEDIGWRPGIYATLGDAYRRNGYWEKAKESYQKALTITNSPPLRFMAAHVFGALADLDLSQGRLRNAESYWRKALTVIQEYEKWGRLPLPAIGWVHIRMGEILYEWNELAQAWEHLAQGLERVELGGDVRAIIAGTLIAGRVKLAQGDRAAAAEYLARAHLLVEETSFIEWKNRCQRFQLELWLAQDRLRAAVDWSDAMLEADAPDEQTENEMAQLTIARVLIVKGDAPSVARALALLELLLRTAQEAGRTGVIIEALALQALAHWRREAQTEAMTALEQALRLAQPEGYIRLFTDLGLPMARLLQEAHSRAVLPDYVAMLLATFADSLPGTTSGPSRLPEPLTVREQEILGLIAAGLTNREIGETLIISPQTVKKHTGTIYGKLSVHSRTEAVARARDLHLLD